MFSRTTLFNSDLSKLNVSMRYMFSKAVSFNSDLSNWNVNNLKEMREMFDNSGVTNIPRWYN